MAEQNPVHEHIKGEREFLHDLSSPLMIAMGMVDAARDSLNPAQFPKECENLDKAKNSLQRITDKVNDRRQLLKTLASSAKNS